RDELLSSADRAAGQMLICVSRAHSERLVLDL
ncbi:MAG: oxidoreductase, partial [Actinomycetota bacterium]|nr:oxidoreductase [Actinomycetota bacterium]